MKQSTYNEQSVRILLVDDNENDYIVTQDIVEQIEYTNITLDWVNSYQKGLSQIVAGQHDLYLIDYRLGPQSGIDLMREAISRGCRLPMIILTGRGTREIDMEAMQEGASDFLVKDDLQPDALERSVRYALERQRVSAQLQANEEKFRAMYENAPLGMVMAQTDGEIIQVNQAFLDFGGYSRDDFANKNFYQFLDTSDPKSTEEVPTLFGDGVPIAVEVLYLRKNGNRVPILLSSAQFTNPQGLDCVWLFAKDITERKEQQEKLLQASQINAVGELAHSVKSELNQHLQTIQIKLSEVLEQEKHHLSTPGRHELSLALQQCESLARLTSGVLARQKQQMVARWNSDKTLKQLRLRMLREPGAARFRRYIMSPEGTAEFSKLLQETARNPSIRKGMEEIHLWLKNYSPPLILPSNLLTVWERIQSTLKEALQELRQSILSATSEANIPQLSFSEEALNAQRMKAAAQESSPSKGLRRRNASPQSGSTAPLSSSSLAHPRPTHREKQQAAAPSISSSASSTSSFRTLTPDTTHPSVADTGSPLSKGSLPQQSSTSNPNLTRTSTNSGSQFISFHTPSSSTLSSESSEHPEPPKQDSSPSLQEAPSKTVQPTSSSATSSSSATFSSVTTSSGTPPIETNRQVNVPTKEQIPLPNDLEDLLVFILDNFEQMKLEQWINKKSFTAYLRRHLYRYQEYNSIPLDPLWETVQKIPGVNPALIKGFFHKLAANSKAVQLDLPLLLQSESHYGSGQKGE